MNTLTNSTGNYTPANDPRYDKPFEPDGGSGILEVTFFCEGEILEEYEVTKYLPYTWTQLGEQFIEVDIEKPMLNCFSIEDSIHDALNKELGKRNDYTLNWITK